MTNNETTPIPADGERADLLEALTKHRGLFLHTVRELDDAQAAARPTASSLCLGGLVKHVAATERQWADFIVNGPWRDDIDWSTVDWSNPPAAVVEHQQQFELLDGETLTAVVADYARVAENTDELVRTADLDVRHELPNAPWFEPGARWSNRRVLLHMIGEIAQHAGHADLIRESIDGQRSMAG